MPDYKKGEIHDVVVRPLSKFVDERGWLTELFRTDELDKNLVPEMAYISMTKPGIARGPHEHVEQTDYFCFLGPGNFKVYLWDARKNSSTYLVKQVFCCGVDNPLIVIVPPGVVHAYKNISNESGIVFNAPNKLYAGEGKKSVVDEIRHEEMVDSPFVLE
ncbi:MAG: dTDP-4-dehydrorhamnose 3,5-epimerase family protein [Desulfuromonadales bacterium]|nr:dTDP-4-dehydrorhamnose 3,5-epimerase family protein [Desulfuromonadales bacterium]